MAQNSQAQHDEGQKTGCKHWHVQLVLRNVCQGRQGVLELKLSGNGVWTMQTWAYSWTSQNYTTCRDWRDKSLLLRGKTIKDLRFTPLLTGWEMGGWRTLELSETWGFLYSKQTWQNRGPVQPYGHPDVTEGYPDYY